MGKETKSALPLPLGAEPAQWCQLSPQSMERELRAHRYLACPNYSRCLDYASTLHWEGWSCKWCSLWKKKGGKEKNANTPKTST